MCASQHAIFKTIYMYIYIYRYKTYLYIYISSGPCTLRTQLVLVYKCIAYSVNTTMIEHKTSKLETRFHIVFRTPVDL